MFVYVDVTAGITVDYVMLALHIGAHQNYENHSCTCQKNTTL